MRRLKAIFPFPRRLRGWLHLEGIPGTELDPPDTGEGELDLCDIEILAIEPLYQPSPLEIESVGILLLDDSYGTRYQATINTNNPDGLQYRVLKDGVEYYGWQENNVFEFPFSDRNNEFDFVAINFWEEKRLRVNILPTTYEAEFGFTGEAENIVVQLTGYYEVELWGAHGGGNPSVAGHRAKGGNVKGKIFLNAGDELYVYTGGEGVYGGDMDGAPAPGGWNGGGEGGKSQYGISGSSGGGATDIRINGTGLENRIAVAGGGAGGNGTGTINRRRDGSSGGGGGYYGGGGGGNYSGNNVAGQGGTQEEGGSGWTSGSGQLGIGGDGQMASTSFTSSTSQLAPGGEGGGLEGGDGIYSSRGSTGGGGSSFIAMLEDGETTTGVREGDGLAKITFLGFGTASYDSREVNKNIDDDFVFTIQYSGLGAEIRILEGVNVLYDWSKDTEFVIDKTLENQEITIEVRDAFDNTVTQTATVKLLSIYEFEATSTGRVGAIQSLTIPATGNYRITAFGAQGGVGNGQAEFGKGAKMSGIFTLTEGQVLDILVGQQGIGGGSGNDAFASGGGGSFVVKQGGTTNDDILVIAGGGGSNVGQYAFHEDAHGSILEAGKDGVGVSGVGVGGQNGNGGQASTGWSGAAAGGGFFTNGENGGTTADGGSAFLNGGFGGAGDSADGGFGGGAGCSDDGSYSRNTGGGGYSGGGSSHSSNSPAVGGGGGSYNAGTSQENVAGIREGNGKVIIESI